MYTLIIEDKNGVIADEFSFDRGTYLIGRVEGNDIILPSSNVSRQHARLFIRDNRCFIEDLGSANGVIVDGQRTQGERDLGTAAQIRIGDYYLYLEFAKDGSEEGLNVVSTHIVSQDANAFKLVRVGDAFAGEEFVLGERQNTIGRTDDNYILLNDPSISRHHSRIDNDGLVYTLSDLGSSNGTRINGKRIATPTLLKENDHVTFGNVEFIFMPSGQQVNPALLVGKGGGKRSSLGLILGLVAVLVLLCLVSGGGVGAYFFFFKQPEPPPPVVERELSEEEKVAQHIAQGRGKMEQLKWDDAIESFDSALAVDPNNDEAKELKTRAVSEREATEQLSTAQELKSKTRFEEAKEKLENIQENTEAYKSARDELKEINTILAGKYKKEAEGLLEEKKYDLARKALIKSLDLKCDKEVVELIDKTEKTMKSGANRRKYGSFDPHPIPPLCK